MHIEEFEIQANDDLNSTELINSNQDKSLLDNKNLVIGKQISPHLYLKYLKPLNTSNNRIKLKCDLDHNWSIELESSTEDGYGADLKFFKETK